VVKYSKINTGEELMKIKYIFLLLVISTFMLVNVVFAGNELKGHAVYVPAGVTVNAVLSQEINSSSAHIGQAINAILIEDFYYNGTLIIPSGSVIMGTIVKSKKAGALFKDGKIEICFSTIRTPYNNIIPIAAKIYTSDLSGVLEADGTKENIKEAAKTSAIATTTGALAGVIVGAVKDNTSVGKGAIYGAALGLGAGIIKSAFDKGEDVIIPVNAQIEIIFEQPITLTAQ
jgi:hypothetical protein